VQLLDLLEEGGSAHVRARRRLDAEADAVRRQEPLSLGTGGTRLAAALAVFFVVLLASRAAHADPPAAQVAVARARQLDLARSSPWRRLLLYKARTGARRVSQVDGADFFLAPHGKQDPAAELEATLAAFFVPFVPGKEDEHALCRFPARFQWLEAQLHFASDLLDKPRCPKLERYVAEVDAESASFVYASSFLENPASAFGHTFLRIKRRGPSDETRDHGVDYTAATDTSNPLFYAFKGIAGLFPGTFRFRTYDAMLRDYAGYEARDLWEYELSLTPGELNMLVLHLWELALTRIDYFYLTENCSYQIIAALDASAPRLDLVASVKADVLPLDTVKAVHAVPGLVRSVVYRPSVLSLFRDAVAKLDARERTLVDVLATNSNAPLPADLPPASAARVFDAAKLALDARWSKTMIDGKNPTAVAARRRLLERAAAITVTTGAERPPPMSEAPLDKEPHKGHASMRAVLGTGLTSQYGTGFATLGWRIALHDLADPPDGHPELAQLQFLDTRIRYEYARQRLTLDNLTFAELMAIKPLTRFEKHLSWRARAFGVRFHDRTAPDSFAHGLDLAVGTALATTDERVAVFVMADAFVTFSGDVDGIGGSVVRAGVGPFGGLRVHLPGSAVALVTAGMSYLPAQSLDTTFEVRAVLRTRLGPNIAMGFEGSAQPRAFEAQLASYLYF
jgi:hypothetical protein